MPTDRLESVPRRPLRYRGDRRLPPSLSQGRCRGGGFVLGFGLPAFLAMPQRRRPAASTNAFIRIGSDGR